MDKTYQLCIRDADGPEGNGNEIILYFDSIFEAGKAIELIDAASNECLYFEITRFE